MWNDIRDEKTLEEFMESMDFFHDSCMKEMKYVSGAYVEEDLGMYPVNDRRILNVIIQRQYEENSMIEMEFSGMKYLQLKPVSGRVDRGNPRCHYDFKRRPCILV